MTRKEKVLLPWECTLGSKSHINLIGKILLSPLIIIMCVTISLLELLFSKDEQGV